MTQATPDRFPLPPSGPRPEFGFVVVTPSGAIDRTTYRATAGAARRAASDVRGTSWANLAASGFRLWRVSLDPESEADAEGHPIVDPADSRPVP